MPQFQDASFFPFTLRAHETRHYTSSPRDFRDTFIAHKPEGLVWYAYDVEVKSATLVKFVVYDTRDTCTGGIGERIDDFEVTVPTSLTRRAIKAEALVHAKARRAVELDEVEEMIISGYADELLASLQVTA